MKRYIGKILCIVFGTLMLIGAVGCEQSETGIQQIESGSTPTENGGEETIVAVPADQPDQTQIPMPTDQVSETAEPTSVPTPFATRPPKKGDVSTDRFPDHDTGENADWSYQSDELRIAITRHEEEEDQIVYYVADIWIRNISSFRIGFGRGKFNSGTEDPETFATREHAILGFSGSYNSGLVIHNGVVTKKNVEKSSIAFRSGILLIYKDGSAKVINRAEKETYNYNKENKTNGGIWHALQFGPVLVQNGKIQEKLGTYARHPRIIFGYCEPGHYIAVAVDGRTKKSIGMTEQEMAELMLSLGCKDAMNLDGGYSAVMLFMGKTISVPAPHRDGDGDVIEGRNLKDMLVFAEYDADGSAPALSDVVPDKVRGE
jgi:hypothetical protein